jgi:hypothetical protein
MTYRDDATAARLHRDALTRALAEVRARLGDRAALEAQERELAAAVAEANRRVDHARAQVKLPLLQELRVASPCSERWDAMTGDDRMRFCGKCQQHVFDVSAMTSAEAEELLRSRDGRACVRFFRRSDGTVLTRDCPEGARRQRRRRFAVAGAAVAVLASLAGGVARAFTGRPAPPPEHPGELGIPMGPTSVAPRPVMGVPAPRPVMGVPAPRPVMGATSVAPPADEPPPR